MSEEIKAQTSIQHTFNLGNGYLIDIDKDYAGSCFSVIRFDYAEDSNFLGSLRLKEEDAYNLLEQLAMVATRSGLDYNKIEAMIKRGIAQGIQDLG